MNEYELMELWEAVIELTKEVFGMTDIRAETFLEPLIPELRDDNMIVLTGLDELSSRYVENRYMQKIREIVEFLSEGKFDVELIPGEPIDVEAEIRKMLSLITGQ